MTPSTSLDGTTSVVRTTTVVTALVDDELVALDIDKGTCFGLNATATRIWELLAVPTAIEPLCDALSEEYAIDRDTCEREVIDLLTELLEDGLIELAYIAPAHS